MKIKIIPILFVSALLFVSCGNKSDTFSSQDGVPSLSINTESKEIIMPCEVNGKYFTESTRHGIVFKDGSNGEKAVLRGLIDKKEFHEALELIGAVAGNNLVLDDAQASSSSEGKSSEGSKLDVYVTWEGSDGEIPFEDIISASEKRVADYRFGGNLELAIELNTGCVLCLDSCPVGIVSDAAYPTGTTQNNEVTFYGNDSILPSDGTSVNVIFRLAE